MCEDSNPRRKLQSPELSTEVVRLDFQAVLTGHSSVRRQKTAHPCRKSSFSCAAPLLKTLPKDKERGLPVETIFFIGEILRRRGSVEAIKGLIFRNPGSLRDEPYDFGNDRRLYQMVLTHLPPRSTLQNEAWRLPSPCRTQMSRSVLLNSS